MRSLLLALALLVSTQAHAGSLYCGADGVVTNTRNVFAYVGNGKFAETNWKFFQNWYAKVLKVKSGPVVDGNGKQLEASETFYLVSQADSTTCGRTITWVRASDFTRVP